MFSKAFLLHLLAAMVSTAIGVVAALALGLAGEAALFAPVAVAAGLTGLILASRLDALKASFVWIPAAIWFIGWAVVSVPQGLDHFMRVFVGTGFCGDFSCAGQVFVTSPLVGSLSYLVAFRGRARRA